MKVKIDEYSKKMDEIIEEGGEVHEILINMLDYASTVKLEEL